MEWLLVIVAIVVLGVAAWAGTGKLGELPPVVTDRPKGRIPAGPLTEELLAELRLPRVSSGYCRQQVDDHLSALLADAADRPSFDVVRGGYDMQVVDELLARFARDAAAVRAAEAVKAAEIDPEQSATAPTTAEAKASPERNSAAEAATDSSHVAQQET